MRKLHTQGVYKALLLAGCATTFTLSAAPAMAQDEEVDCAANPDDPACVDDGNRIVVTGSRIARPDYVANSPTVSVDENFLRESSTAAIEQQLNKLPQFVVAQSSTASNSSETGILPAGGDIQPNATNTPGAATVSLRGVGANRTLVLIDGRRGTPSNAGGAVDVSTIPNAALERVEIVSGGASATYGADAVAGVTNFILKSDFQGIEIDGQFGINERGDGFEYQIGGIVGTDFPDGRGNVSLAMSLNTREDLFQRDLPWYRDLWADPSTTSGSYFFTPRPGVSGITIPAANAAALAAAFPGANPPVSPNNLSVFLNEDGSLFTTGFTNRGGSAFIQPWPALDDGELVDSFIGTTDVGTLKFINENTPATVPTTRYNFLARGNYEINDWIGVFGQGMFSNNTTYTAQEPGPLTFGWDAFIPWGTQPYTGQMSTFFGTYTNPAVPSSILLNGQGGYVDPTPAVLTDNPINPAFVNGIQGTTFQGYNGVLPCATPGNPAYGAVGGCTNTQAFQDVVPDQLEGLLNARTNPNAPVSLLGFLPNLRETYTDVTTYQLVAGLEGGIPGTDWTWEAFVNHGISRNLSRQTGMYSLERVRAIVAAPNMGENFSFRGNAFGGAGGISAGFGASTGTCATGLNFFGGYQGISDDCREAIAADVSNRITTRQTIAEVNLQGGLFDLPAGQLRFAVGASYRENRFEFINETLSSAGRSFLDQVIGIYPSTNMEMQGIDAKELYGELLIPVLSDIPFIQEFNLEVGGRMSHYNTTGTSYTFKILGDWQVTDWLRFRGGFNRAERMPNIAELLLTPQQAFRTDPIGDVCSTRHNNPGSANPETNTTNALDVQAMCLALMQRDNGGTYVPITDMNSFYYAPEAQARQPTGGGFAFSYAVGNQYYRENINANATPLEPEVADTITAGFVIQSPMASGPLSRLNLTVDYFNIKIKDPISAVGAGGILLRCVSPAYNPAAEGVAGGAATPADLSDPAIIAAAQAAIASSTCPTVFRTASAGFGATGGLNSARVIGTYGNEGEIQLSGIDATVSWSQDAGPGTVFVSLNGNYMSDFKIQTQDGQPFLDYVGTLGTGALGVNSGASFEYRIFGTVGYNWGPANISLQWQHIPATEDGAEVFFLNGVAPEGTDNSGIPAYNLFNLNAGYQVNDNLRLRAGIDNLFGKRPPITGIDVDTDPSLGQLPQGGFSLFHDVLGRRFSLGANIRV